jgi:catechol 2,3-dioxygenase-like lactoylglutathione lyase family enzyme
MIGRLYSIVLDCPDPEALARFYEGLLGLRREKTLATWVVSGDGAGTRIAFQSAPDLRTPRWPDPAHPQQVHLDVMVDDVDEAQARVLELGATRLPGEGDDFRVFADPVGHPFCLVWDTNG